MSNLPYDPQNPQYEWFRIGPNDPPFIPQIPLRENWMQQYLGYATGCLASFIQSEAANSPLRMFMFNASADHNWQNADFVGLVQKTLDFVAMMLANRKYQNPDEGIYYAHSMMVDLATAVNVRDYPALKGYISGQEYQEVMGAIGDWDAITRDLNHFLGGMHRPQDSHRSYDPQQVQMGVDNRSRGVSQGAYPSRQGNVGTSRSFSRDNFTATNSGSTERYGRTRPAAPQGDPGQPNLRKRDNVYARMQTQGSSHPEPRQVETRPTYPARRTEPLKGVQQPIEARTEMPETEQLIHDADGSFLVAESESEFQWKPSEDQPYRPLYHPLTQERYYRILEDGTTLVEVRERDPNEMEYDKHQLPSFGSRRPGLQYDHVAAMDRMARAAKAIDEATRLQQAGETLTPDNVSEEANATRLRLVQGVPFAFIHPSRPADVSERVLWLNASVNRLAELGKMDGPLDIHRTHCSHADPVISKEDNTEFIKKLSQASSYVSLAEELQAGVGLIDQRLIEVINKRMIQMVNRVCSLYLSLPDGDAHISDSFDSETLRDQEQYILREYGPIIHQAYKTHQKRHIRSVFWEIDTQTKDEITGNLFGDIQFKEGTKPYVNFLASQLSLTFLDLYAHELDITIDFTTSSLIEAGNAQALHAMAVQLFESTKNDGGFYRHLVQTNDGEIFELLKGDIGQDAYLIARSPEVWME